MKKYSTTYKEEIRELFDSGNYTFDEAVKEAILLLASAIDSLCEYPM